MGYMHFFLAAVWIAAAVFDKKPERYFFVMAAICIALNEISRGLQCFNG